MRQNPAKKKDPVERAARALYEHDAERSTGLANAEYVWPRVKPIYMKKAKLALDAAKEAT